MWPNDYLTGVRCSILAFGDHGEVRVGKAQYRTLEMLNYHVDVYDETEMLLKTVQNSYEDNILQPHANVFKPTLIQLRVKLDNFSYFRNITYP